jgi:hypothetical protein
MSKKTSDKTNKADNVNNADNKTADNETQALVRSNNELNDAMQKIATAISTLSDEKADAFESAIAVLNPEKEGFETTEEDTASLPRLKIRQGMSTDAPDDVKLGELYTDMGDSIGGTIQLIPLYMYRTHRRFEDQDAGIMGCASEDTKTSIYGDACAECPDLPFRDGKITKCNKTVELIAIGSDFKSIYRVSFMKTSYRAGAQIYRQAKASSVAWEKIFTLSTAPRTRQGSSGNYYVFEAKPSGEKVDPKEYNALGALQKLIILQRQQYLQSLSNRRSSQAEIIEKAIAEEDATDANADASVNYENL